MTRAQLARAARTFAEAHAPFADTGALILRTPQGAAIWYWDKAQLAALGAGSAGEKVSPESVWRTGGDGWRILACAEGFEAQYWQGGGLIASSWRREAFTREQWAAFVLGIESFERAPPDMPPAPMRVPMDDASWRRAQIKAPLGWRDLEVGALSAGLCAVALAAMFSGQALRHESGARAQARQADAIAARIRQDANIARAQARAVLLNDYSASFETANALAAIADAFTVLGRFGVQAQSWSADQERLSLTIASAITETPVREIVAALEETPSLCGVTPELANAEAGFELRATIVRNADAPCRAATDGGAP